MRIYYILIALYFILLSNYPVYCQIKTTGNLIPGITRESSEKLSTDPIAKTNPSRKTAGLISPDSTVPLPVELDYFNVALSGRDVRLDWETSVEINNYGFGIERAVSNDTANIDNSVDLNNWKEIGFVKGSGNSNSKRNYSFTDFDPSGGIIYRYRLRHVDNQGNYLYSRSAAINIIPQGFALSMNYPNPFNPSTSIDYKLPYESKIIIKLYNIIGKEVATLVNTVQGAGKYSIKFDAGVYKNLASGTYIYRMEAGNFISSRKLILLK